MAALAGHIAVISRRRHPETAAPAEVAAHFAEMGRIAVRLAADAKNVVLEEDPARVAQLCVDNDGIDDIHRDLFNLVMDPAWSFGTTTAVDVTLLSIYQATGMRQH